ncbi:MAG: bis(5'-nucleosyl)-tetraphosphatase (symmetrical) YqeK [Clostridia bacterium]|nr:bis(5'-nucleosyl)-tetraphosphatase (symmetrical) YqeK [Clostridia bacterium]
MTQNVTVPEYAEYKEILKGRLSPKRFEHSLCVADEALRLAVKYGGDVQKAYLAGLLHDITKNTVESEHFKLFNTFGAELSEIEQTSEKLWHAISGALYIRYLLNIDDAELIDAVRYHTTAKAEMSLLAKILYLADFTSADRDYDDVDVMRRLVDESMDKAMAYALRYTVLDLAERNLAIHPDTLSAFNEIMLKRRNNNG